MQHRKREDSSQLLKGKSMARNEGPECTNPILSFVISPRAHDFFKKTIITILSVWVLLCFCIVLFCFGLFDHPVTSSDLFLRGHKERKAEEMLGSVGRESSGIGQG